MMVAPVREDEVTFFGLANSLLRRWRIVIGIAVVCAGLALAFQIFRPPVYVATASFMPQSTDVQRSGLAALAGQFGIGLGGPTGERSPKFYVDLFRSYEFLAPIVRETLMVAEKSGVRGTLADLYEIRTTDSVVREAESVRLLMRLVAASADTKTDVVSVAVTTKWPSVSATVANRLVDRVNDYNLHVRQSQAAFERRFVSAQLQIARDTLRAAEDKLKLFLQQNRQYATSPALTFEHDRLQRDVMAAQQIVVTLSQAYEDAKIREVRDTPVITVVEPVRKPFKPKSRRLATRAVLGLLMGGMGAMIEILLMDAFERRRRKGDPEVEEFVSLLQRMRGAIFRRARSSSEGRAVHGDESTFQTEPVRPKGVN